MIRLTRLRLAFCLASICLATLAPESIVAAPPTEQAIARSIARGVEFLLKAQNKDGSWGSHRKTKGLNIYAPAPGSPRAFRLATTALCISAMIEIGQQDAKVLAATRRAEDWLLEDLPKLRRATPGAIYNVWAHAYGIQALVRMHAQAASDADRQKKIRQTIEHQIGMLGRYEFVNGGWGYYDMVALTQRPSGDPTSFTTSTILIALAEAKALGIEVPDKMVRRALAAVVRQRAPDFSYSYSDRSRYRPGSAINRPPGALGRAQVCNLACREWGDKKVTQKVFRDWLDRLFSRNYWLDIGRKRPVPHESWAQVAGYFYYYGHYYAAQCIEQLPKAEQKKYQAKMATLIMSLQERDGSWWDYPFYDYHQPYGTAFALMTLGRCQSIDTASSDRQ
jgi:hypothetical protein